MRPCKAFLILGLLVFVSLCATLVAQEPPAAEVKPAKPATSTDPMPTTAPLPTPAKVDVEPVNSDYDIGERLTSILMATEWFAEPKVVVRDGVAFLYGETSTQRYRDWAQDLARNTQDVAAVVNRINVRESSIWDMTPVKAELISMWRRTIIALPYLLLGSLILSLSFWSARLGTRISRRVFRRRFDTPLLQEVLARGTGTIIFLLGLYFVLRLYGLTRLAATVLGGTGLVGLVLGIAFRDITENFLASIFLSMQNPFRAGDLVQIGTETGYVQRLNARTTVLMNLDGNYVQIPNATVYKASIVNFMSNPNRRESFVVSIGYRESISDAQSLALSILNDHPAVLKDPEPWVLVDGLTADLVQLKIYFWFNGREHSALKVRSSIIRLVKRAFQEKGIRLPAAPAAGLAVSQLDALIGTASSRPNESQDRGDTKPARERRAVATRAEGGLQSEEKELQSQADQARPEDQGEDLLKSSRAGSDGASLTTATAAVAATSLAAGTSGQNGN